jgi:hypothetical protein
VDLAALFGVDPSVPPGVSQVRVKIHAKSPNATQEQLQALIAAVEQTSTLRDTLVRPVDVITTPRRLIAVCSASRHRHTDGGSLLLKRQPGVSHVRLRDPLEIIDDRVNQRATSPRPGVPAPKPMAALPPEHTDVQPWSTCVRISLPALKYTDFLAGTATDAPVLELRPYV